jgi:hypothetical protein
MLLGLGIGIEKTNAGIGIPASQNFIPVPDYKNAGLCELSPDLFWYR